MATFLGRSNLASGTSGTNRSPNINTVVLWKNDLVFCLVMLRYAGADAETITFPAGEGWSLTSRLSVGTTASYALYQKLWAQPGNTDDPNPTVTVSSGGKWGAILTAWRSPTGAWDLSAPVAAVATNAGNNATMTTPSTSSPRNQCTACRIYCTTDNNSPNTTSEGAYAISGGNVNVNTGSGYSAGWTYLDNISTGSTGTATLLQTANAPDDYVSWSLVLVPRPTPCGTFLSLSQPPRQYRGISQSLGNDVYACVRGDDVYVQPNGVGNFVPTGWDVHFATLNFSDICFAPDGTIYVACDFDDIYVSTDGGASFTALGAGALAWYSICAAPNGDVYAAASTDGPLGDLYVRVGGAGSFVGLGYPAQDWSGVAAANNGNIYATSYLDDIYVRIGGAGPFVPLGAPALEWFGIGTLPNGYLLACNPATFGGDGDIYLSTDGGATFNAIDQPGINCAYVCGTRVGNAYGTAIGEDVYEAVCSVPIVLSSNDHRAVGKPPKISDVAQVFPSSQQQVVSWGYEQPEISIARVVRRSDDLPVIPPTVVLPWTPDHVGTAPKIVARRGEDLPAIPPLVVSPWVPDAPTTSEKTRARDARPDPDLVVPPLLVSPWVGDQDQVVVRTRAKVGEHGDVVVPSLPLPPWGFEVTGTGLVVPRRSPRDEDPYVVPPTTPLPASPWGFESDLVPRGRPRRRTVEIPDVFPKPLVPPPPTPNLPIEVLIPGGGGRLPGTEVVFGPEEPNVADLHAYLDALWEGDDEEYEATAEADYVMGRAEYERERARRAGAPPPPPRPSIPTSFKFTSELDDESRRRIVMLAADARLHGLPVREADAFPLRYRLKIFDRSYEKAMRGGTMVRITPESGELMLPVARLARVHRYRLVLWTPTSLYFFDKTTLRPRISGATWLAVGAGLSLWMGYEIWKK